MKVIKLFAWLVALILALVMAALVYFYFNLNMLVKRGVEEVGPKLTQTAVKLDKVDITLSDGRVSLLGFAIANPKQYSAANAFEFAEFSLQIDPASLSEKVVVINNIVVSGISITAEQIGSTTNLQEIKKAIDSYLPPGAQENSNTTESSGSGLLFMVENLEFNNASLRLITEKYGEKAVNLPAFNQQNIGTKQAGVSVEQLASIALKSLSNNAKRAAEKELQELLTDEVKTKAKEKAKQKLEEKAGKKLDKLKGLFKQLKLNRQCVCRRRYATSVRIFWY